MSGCCGSTHPCLVKRSPPHVACSKKGFKHPSNPVRRTLAGPVRSFLSPLRALASDLSRSQGENGRPLERRRRVTPSFAFTYIVFCCHGLVPAPDSRCGNCAFSLPVPVPDSWLQPLPRLLFLTAGSCCVTLTSASGAILQVIS